MATPPAGSPTRDFRVIADAPFNGSPSPGALVVAHTTPADAFFIRNHAPVPDATPPLTIGGLVERAGLVDLGSLPRTSVEATLQCAGNRRTALFAYRDIPGEIPWGDEAIGNAVWEGVSLAAVLDHVHVTVDDPRTLHVWFRGADEVAGKGNPGDGFGASIPFDKAMSPGVILADTMNGVPLAPDHGAPLRVVVPGYIGARSVKWLREVRVERTPSPNYFQAGYSLVMPNGAPPVVLGELPVNSAIGVPPAGAPVAPGALTVRGWAMSGGDRTIERVEVSADGGTTWRRAELLSPEKRYVWRLWEARVLLAPGRHELICRAVDSRGNTQPADVAEVWNRKGYVNNAWHRIGVTAG